MKKTLSLIIISVLFIFHATAEKIYLMNGTGYNTAEPQLINAITANGHTVTVQTTNLYTLPAGFTTVCNDPVNGYDWLCFFGNIDYSLLLTQVKAFIDAGGKVYYQYEVDCCTQSSTSVAALLSGLTGLTITPNANAYIALPNNAPVLQGWIAEHVDTCITIIGSAYKGLDGLPLNRQFIADTALYNSMPPVSTCKNFGFFFTTTDFTGSAHNGAITGMGDVNTWYDGDEPIWNGGLSPVDTSLINYFFPASEKKCFLFPLGCMFENTTGVNEINILKNQLTIFPNPVSSAFTIRGLMNATEINILDLNGKILLNKIIHDDELIDLSDFAKGVYILKTTSTVKMILKI